MAKRNKTNQTLCVEEIARKNPVLTKEELNDCYTYEELADECLRTFNEAAERIDREYALRKNSEEQ